MKILLIFALIFCAILEVVPRRSNRIQDHYKMGEKKPGDFLIYSKQIDEDGRPGGLIRRMGFPGLYIERQFTINYLEIIDYNHFKSYTESLLGGVGTWNFSLTQCAPYHAYMDIEVNVWGTYDGVCVTNRGQNEYKAALKSALQFNANRPDYKK